MEMGYCISGRQLKSWTRGYENWHFWILWWCLSPTRPEDVFCTDSQGQPLAVCWGRNISWNTQPLNINGFSLCMGKDEWYFKINKMAVVQARKGDHKAKLPWFHFHATLEQEIAAQLTSEWERRCLAVLIIVWTNRATHIKGRKKPADQIGVTEAHERHAHFQSKWQLEGSILLIIYWYCQSSQAGFKDSCKVPQVHGFHLIIRSFSLSLLNGLLHPGLPLSKSACTWWALQQWNSLP